MATADSDKNERFGTISERIGIARAWDEIAAADAAAHGQDFLDPDVDPQRASGLRLKLFCRLDDQIVVVGNAGKFGMQANNPIFTHGKGHFIAVVEKLKQRLQFVIAIFATTENVQHQIKLCRGGQNQSVSIQTVLHLIDPTSEVANL